MHENNWNTIKLLFFQKQFFMKNLGGKRMDWLYQFYANRMYDKI